MSLERTLEAILFAVGKPISFVQLKTVLQIDDQTLREALDQLMQKRNTDESGIHILQHDGKIQSVTHPEEAQIVEQFIKEEIGGELTKPSLETLTIIAYRGPITKPEIERIRGINCTLILRNLLMRGLVMEKEDKDRLQLVYTISLDFLRHLGVHSVEELPEYVSLHTHHDIDVLLAKDMPEV